MFSKNMLNMLRVQQLLMTQVINGDGNGISVRKTRDIGARYKV